MEHPVAAVPKQVLSQSTSASDNAQHSSAPTPRARAADCVPLGSTLVGGSCAQFVGAFKDKADALASASDATLRAAIRAAPAPDASCCSDAAAFVNGVRPRGAPGKGRRGGGPGRLGWRRPPGAGQRSMRASARRKRLQRRRTMGCTQTRPSPPWVHFEVVQDTWP